jgi:hypothetical protein
LNHTKPSSGIQLYENGQAEAENGRQLRMPLWVMLGRIILARGSHAGRPTEAGRSRGRQTEAVVGRLRGRQ